MPQKRKGAAKVGKKKEKEVVDEVEETTTKTIPKTKSKASKTITPAKKNKTKTAKEKKKEEDEAARENEEDIESQNEALEEENNSENEVQDDLQDEEEASIDVEESKPIKDYPKYLKKSWLLQIPTTYNKQLSDDGSYYNVQTSTITQLSDVIKLTKKEEDNLDKITEVKDKDNSTNKSIRKKLDEAGYGIISYARVIGDKDYIDELRSAIENKKSVDSFEIKPKKTVVLNKKATNKTITPAKKPKKPSTKKTSVKTQDEEPIEEETEPIALPEEDQELEEVDAIYERNVDGVIERLETASDDNPICIDVINAVESCADTKKSIKKIKLSKKEGFPNVDFTYPAKTDYSPSDLRDLAIRYIEEYNNRQNGGKKGKKSKTKESSKAERNNLAQPRGGPTRTVGDKEVNSVTRPGAITTPGIEAGESKRPVLRSLAAPELLKVVKELRGKYVNNINYKPVSRVKEETDNAELSGENGEDIEEEGEEEVKPKKKEKTTIRVKPLGKKAPAQEEEEEAENEENENEEEAREEENEEEEEEPDQVELGSEEQVEEDNSQGDVDHEDDEEENSEE